jgi:hypothetical protein
VGCESVYVKTEVNCRGHEDTKIRRAGGGCSSIGGVGGHLSPNRPGERSPFFRLEPGERSPALGDPFGELFLALVIELKSSSSCQPAQRISQPTHRLISLSYPADPAHAVSLSAPFGSPHSCSSRARRGR